LHLDSKNRRVSITIMPQVVIELFQRDPFLGYTLLAALFLAGASLLTGWLRLDFLAVFRPRGLFQLLVAVVVAVALSLLSESSAPFMVNAATGEAIFTLSGLRGLSRLPLYIIALAYGPTAGLFSGGLYALLTLMSGEVGWAEAVLTLELTVLGWFAIAPSPFKLFWAGPVNVVLAYFLTWATGGSAFLQHTTREAVQLQTHWLYHQNLLWGVALSVALLFLLRPQLYQRLFAGSRISPPQQPAPAEPALRQTIQLQTELMEHERQRRRSKLTEFPVESVRQFGKPREKN
jgi:hypothetical protein